MRGLLQTKRSVGLVCLFLCGLIGCSPVAKVVTQHPDEVLFQRGMEAACRKDLTAAHITLATLVNTYPDSQYAQRAKAALQDPQFANCEDSWTTSSECEITETMEP